MSKKDFFPRRIGDQRNWLENYRTQIPATGPLLGMTPTEIDESTDAADLIITSIDATIAAENVYQQKVADKDMVMKEQFSQVLRPAIKRIKTSSTYTVGAGELLGIEGADSDFDPDTFIPTLKAQTFPGEVKLSFTKGGADGVVVYARTVQGSGGLPPSGDPTDTDFDTIAIDLHSPYVDNRPLATPNTPEVREYYVRGILNDHQIGQPSAIIRVTVGS